MPTMLQAIEDLNVTEVSRLIADGFDVNKPCSNNDLPLKIAISKIFVRNHQKPINEEKAFEVVKVLLDAGAVPTTVNIDNEPVLIYLCQQRDILSFFAEKDNAEELQFNQLVTRLVTLLLSCKSPVSTNARNREGRTAFLCALLVHNTALATLLLQNGADPTIPDPTGATALHFTHRKDKNLFQLLINRGMDINATDQQGRTVLDYSNDPDTILLLLKRGAVPKQVDLLYFFQVAQQQKHQGLIDYLFSIGLVKYKSEKSGTAIYHAQSFEALERLLKEGASVEGNDSWDSPLFTQIHIGIQDENEFVRRISLFRRHKANFACENKEGDTLLHQSTYLSDTCFGLLINAGVPLNVKNKKGKLALHVAAKNFRLSKVKLMLDRGCDPAIPDQEEGILPLEEISYLSFRCREQGIAAELCSDILMKLLGFLPEDYLPSNSHDLMLIAVELDSIPLLESLYKRGASLTSKKPELDVNSLELAARINRVNVLRWCLPKIKEDSQRLQILTDTLGTAVSYFHHELTSELIVAGADVNRTTSEGKTILSCFTHLFDCRLECYPTDEERTEAVGQTFAVLIRSHIDVNQAGKDQRTLLEELFFSYGSKSQCWSLMAILLKLGATLPRDNQAVMRLVHLAVTHHDHDAIFSIITACSLPVWRQEVLHFVARLAIAEGNIELLNQLKTRGIDFTQVPHYHLINGHQQYLIDDVLNVAVTGEKETDEQKSQRLKRQELVVSYLLKQEIPVHYLVRNGGYSLLHRAAARGWVEIVAFLLQPHYKFEVDQRSPNFESGQLETPLQVAVAHNQVLVAKDLLARGANPLVRGRTGKTLLHVACEKGYPEMVEVLLDTHIDKDASYTEQVFIAEVRLTAIQNAVNNTDKKTASTIIQILLSHDVKVDGLLLVRLMQGKFDVALIRRVLERIPKAELLERRILHVAIGLKELANCQLLLESLPIEKQESTNAVTARHDPLDAKRSPEYFLELISLRDMRGRTPLHRATEPGCEAIFNYLLQRKADIHVCDYEGYSVSVHAFCHGTMEALKLSLPASVSVAEIRRLRTQLIEQPEFKNMDQDKSFLLSLHCYKLILAFRASDSAMQYISKYKNKDSNQPVHDLCLFQLPNLENCRQAEWIQFVLNIGPEALNYLYLSLQVETLLGRVPTSLEELIRVAQSIKFIREKENPALAGIFVQYHIPEIVFNRILDNYRPKAKDMIPDVEIDGAEFNEPRFRMRRLKASNLHGFVIGEDTHCCQKVGAAGEACAMHGMVSIYGAFYVIYKLPDPKKLERMREIIEYSNNDANIELFLKRFKDKAQRQKFQKQFEEVGSFEKFRTKLKQDYEIASREEEIVAQSWVWLSEHEALVFDSWERLRAEDDRLCQPFLERFADKVLKSTDIKCVLLGRGGQTPDNLPFKLIKNAEYPKDYYGYRDSHEQYLVKSKEDMALSTQSNVQLLIGGIGMFARPVENVSNASYQPDQVDCLLLNRLKMSDNLVLLPACDLGNMKIDARLPQLESFMALQTETNSRTRVCILPLLTKEKWWTAIVILRGRDIIHSKHDWNVIAYLDFSARPMPEECYPLLAKCKLHNHYDVQKVTSIFNENQALSGLWLVENLQSIAMSNKLIVTPLDSAQIEIIKVQHDKILNLAPSTIQSHVI